MARLLTLQHIYIYMRGGGCRNCLHLSPSRPVNAQFHEIMATTPLFLKPPLWGRWLILLMWQALLKEELSILRAEGSNTYICPAYTHGPFPTSSKAANGPSSTGGRKGFWEKSRRIWTGMCRVIWWNLIWAFCGYSKPLFGEPLLATWIPVVFVVISVVSVIVFRWSSTLVAPYRWHQNNYIHKKIFWELICAMCSVTYT